MPEAQKIYKSVEGVAEKAQPFFVKSKEPNDNLAIIIHGFSSSPYRLHFIADRLAEQGYDVEVILLAGHGGDLERLRQSTANQWLASAEDSLKENIPKYKNIYLMGYSYGANLAIHLTLRYPQVKAIVSLGIPIFLHKEKTIRLLLPLAKRLLKNYRKRWVEPEQIQYLTERGHHVHIPIKSLVEFREFIDRCTKRDIPLLKTPILIIHSRQDKVSDPISSQYLFSHLTTPHKSVYILSQGNHQLENGIRKDYIAKKIVEFFGKY